MATELHARVPAELVKRIDKFAADEFLNRSEAVRELIERGLNFGRPVLTGEQARKRIAAVIAKALAP
jgi:metal-responsive CopG/Arc/MetJ family transcriptional regulator